MAAMSRALVEAYETFPFLPGAAMAPAVSAGRRRRQRLQCLRPGDFSPVAAAVWGGQEEEGAAVVGQRRRSRRLVCIAADRLKECAASVVSQLEAAQG